MDGVKLEVRDLSAVVMLKIFFFHTPSSSPYNI